MSITPETTTDDEIDLGKLLSTIWRGRLWVGGAILAGLALGLLVLANTAPTYQADALLQLEERSGSLALPSNLSDLVDNDPRSATEIEILRSRMVLGRAIADQNLDWQVSPNLVPVIGVMLARYSIGFLDVILPERFARPNERVTLANLLVPPQLLNIDLHLEVTGAESYTLELPDGTVLVGKTGQTLVDKSQGVSISVANLGAAPGRRFTLRQIDERSAINALRSRLSVSEVGRSSGILAVNLKGTDRSETVRALDAIVRAYAAQNVARSAAEAESSLTFIREQLPQAEKQMRAAEAAINEFRQKQATVDLSLETQAILEQVTQIEGELVALQRREDELAQRFTPAHPNYQQLLDDRARLEQRLDELRSEVGQLPETQRQILNFSRELELSQGIYTELLTRAQEVEVLRASTIGNVRVVDNASSSASPIAPRGSVILALSLTLGALSGIAAVLIMQWLRRGVQDPVELEKLGLPVLATINYSKEGDTKGQRGGRLPILALESGADLAIEAMRSLRTGLHFGMLDAATPSLTVTSSHPGAGKSFVSVNLAAVMANAGQRVCVVDADLRRGQLRRYFDVPRNAPGLAELLAGDLEIAAAIRQTELENLFFISTGRYPPNPSELLMRAELAALVEHCAQSFDLVIFDAPPVLAVTDPVILGRNTGATIFIARHDITPIGEIDAAQKTFATSGLKFSGAVLNGFDPQKNGGNYGYGYGYGYGYRYAYTTRQDSAR